MRQDSDPDGRSPMDTVDRLAFAEVLEDGGQGRRSPLRLGPALGAAAVAVLVVAGMTIVPNLTKNPMGLPASGQPGGAQGRAGTSGQAAPGQGVSGQAPEQQQQPPAGLPANVQSGSSLTYANTAIVGPGGACCWSSGGAWSGSANGGYPEYGGPVRTSSDPNAWFEWNLGQPAGGSRWDQVKVRVWLPQSQAGAWVRFTVTSTAGGAANTVAFDVAQQEYEGWYELPATFTLGTPDRRTGSAWVRMTYLRPYADAAGGSACADGSCRRMAAAQAEFLWS